MGQTCNLPKDCSVRKILLNAKTIKLDEISTSKTEEKNLNFDNNSFDNFNNNEINKEIVKEINKDFLFEHFLINIFKRDENFTKNLTEELNQLRTNPKNYAKKIEEFIKNINESYFFDDNYILFENFPIYLKEGKKEFIEISNLLKNEQNGNENLLELENREDLKIPFPEFMDEWDNNDYINFIMKKFIEENIEKYELVEFIYIRTVQNAEISAILNLVNEDFDKDMGKMRSCIFKKEIKYVGINYKEIDENYCALYIILAQ